MKIQTLSVDSIITNRDSVHSYFAWPTVARLRDGRLAVTASGFRYYHKCPFGKGVISFSTDEGNTWSIPAITFDTPMDDRDSGVVPFGESGVMVTSINRGPHSSVFLDGCDNKPALKSYVESYLNLMREKDGLDELTGSLYRISNDNGMTFGEIQQSPVSNPHGPVLLPNGDFLWVGNRSLKSGRGIDGTNLACYRLCLDGSYEYLSDIEPIGNGVNSYEPYAFVTNSGKIIVHIRAEAPKACAITQPTDMFTIYQCESYDGGKTFTKPHSIGLDISSGAPPHIVDDNGVLISVYARRAMPHQIRAAFSYDEGETWYGDNVILDLDDTFEDFGYPTSVILKDGSVLTVFYGGDHEANNMSFWAGPNTPIYEFKTPVIRQVIWKYTKE